jgi:hypothetical protein
VRTRARDAWPSARSSWQTFAWPSLIGLSSVFLALCAGCGSAPRATAVPAPTQTTLPELAAQTAVARLRATAAVPTPTVTPMPVLAALPTKHLAIGLTAAEWENLYGPPKSRRRDQWTFASSGRELKVIPWFHGKDELVQGVTWKYRDPVTREVAQADVLGFLPADAELLGTETISWRSVDHFKSGELGSLLANLPVGIRDGFWGREVGGIRGEYVVKQTGEVTEAGVGTGFVVL